jgi:hypothetical protein
MFTTYEVVNFGVAGYSTVQSLIQVREALQGGKKPEIAVLTYGSWQDERNCLARTWIKHIITYGATLKKNARLPCVKIGRDNEPVFLYKKFKYHPTFLPRHSALVNLLDQKYNQLQWRLCRSNEVSRATIREFARICKDNGVILLVTGLIEGPATCGIIEHCRDNGIMAADISVDRTVPANVGKDGNHPSPVANERFAEKLGGMIREALSGHSAEDGPMNRPVQLPPRLERSRPRPAIRRG